VAKSTFSENKLRCIRAVQAIDAISAAYTILQQDGTTTVVTIFTGNEVTMVFAKDMCNAH
jgi:hypothetical protein